MWKLHQLPKDKPPGDRDNVYRILYINWVRCRKTYTNKRQWLQISVDILMSLFDQRLVSLFDTCKGKKSKKEATSQTNDNAEDYANDRQTSELKPWEMNSQSESEDIFENTLWKMAAPGTQGSMIQSWLDTCADDNSPTNNQRETQLADIEMGDIHVDPNLNQGQPHPSNSIDSDSNKVSDRSIFSKASAATNIESECSHDDMSVDDEYPKFDMKFVNMNCIENNESDENISLSDFRSVIDDRYNTDPKEQRIVLWRHIFFHIVRGRVPGQPNILLMKLSILHTKKENNKPRV